MTLLGPGQIRDQRSQKLDYRRGIFYNAHNHGAYLLFEQAFHRV
jgi:hypothetical protein